MPSGDSMLIGMERLKATSNFEVCLLGLQTCEAGKVFGDEMEIVVEVVKLTS
jgi:hypothetical protein